MCCFATLFQWLLFFSKEILHHHTKYRAHCHCAHFDMTLQRSCFNSTLFYSFMHFIVIFVFIIIKSISLPFILSLFCSKEILHHRVKYWAHCHCARLDITLQRFCFNSTPFYSFMHFIVIFLFIIIKKHLTLLCFIVVSRQGNPSLSYQISSTARHCLIWYIS